MSLRARARAAFGARRLRVDYKRTFDSPHGRRVLGHIYDGGELSQTTLRRDTQGRVDAEAMLIAEGRRQMALNIRNMLGMSEEDIMELEEQNAEDGGSGYE